MVNGEASSTEVEVKVEVKVKQDREHGPIRGGPRLALFYDCSRPRLVRPTTYLP